MNIDLANVSEELRSTAAWAGALLHGLARDEAAGRRPPRLTEPRLDTWRRFRGRLQSTDLLAMLFEDAAVIHRIPFDAEAIGGPIHLDLLPAPSVDGWIEEIGKSELKSNGAEYVAEQAKLLRLSTRMARSDLHVVKPHQKVLELPGSGGQLAHYLVSTHRNLSLQENFTVACTTWQELTLAGLVGLDLGAPHSEYAVKIDIGDMRSAEHPLRQRSFDFVIGVHPEKGGAFEVEEQLAIWFSNAKILLV